MSETKIGPGDGPQNQDNMMAARVHQEITLLTGSKEASTKAYNELFAPAGAKPIMSLENAKEYTKRLIPDGSNPYEDVKKLIGSMKDLNTNPYYKGQPLSAAEIRKDQEFLISQDSHLPPAQFAPDGSVSFPALSTYDVSKELANVGTPGLDKTGKPSVLPVSYLDAIQKIADNHDQLTPQEKVLEDSINKRVTQWMPLVAGVDPEASKNAQLVPAINETNVLRDAAAELKARENGPVR